VRRISPMPSVMGFCSVASPYPFLPFAGVLLPSVSDSFPYPSCLCLPLRISLFFSKTIHAFMISTITPYLKQESHEMCFSFLSFSPFLYQQETPLIPQHRLSKRIKAHAIRRFYGNADRKSQMLRPVETIRGGEIVSISKVSNNGLAPCL
jgi:hypothetical protein